MTDPNIKAKDKESEVDRIENTINGKLMLNIVHARDLIPDDGTTADPYVNIIFP